MSNIYTNDSSNSALGPTTLSWLRAALPRSAALPLGAALLLSACHGQAPPAAPPAVVVALPVHLLSGTDGGGSLQYPVDVAARYSNVMSFRVAGKVLERKVRLGDTVHRGEVVARLDPIDAEKQAASARAALDAAEHRLVFAHQQLDRDKAQFAQNLIAANQFEQTDDAYIAALAGRDQLADQWVVARNTLQYNSLVADHDGVITSENADTGQFVAAGQAVYGLAWAGDIDVNLDAAASELGKITIGQRADVTFPALPGRSFAARVREVAPAADPQSRTYRVKLTLLQSGPEVRLGMTGDAKLAPPSLSPPSEGAAAGAAPMFRIPATAVFHSGKDPAVWVIRAHDSTLELRPVTVRSYAERSAIVSGGLTEGESVVLAGVHTVYAGERVTPVKPLFADEGTAEAAAPGAMNAGPVPMNARPGVVNTSPVVGSVVPQ
jgi:membrane fusion protein, multidrug efflux system